MVKARCMDKLLWLFAGGNQRRLETFDEIQKTARVERKWGPAPLKSYLRIFERRKRLFRVMETILAYWSTFESWSVLRI